MVVTKWTNVIQYVKKGLKRVHSLNTGTQTGQHWRYRRKVGPQTCDRPCLRSASGRSCRCACGTSGWSDARSCPARTASSGGQTASSRERRFSDRAADGSERPPPPPSAGLWAGSDNRLFPSAILSPKGWMEEIQAETIKNLSAGETNIFFNMNPQREMAPLQVVVNTSCERALLQMFEVGL